MVMFTASRPSPSYRMPETQIWRGPVCLGPVLGLQPGQTRPHCKMSQEQWLRESPSLDRDMDSSISAARSSCVLSQRHQQSACSVSAGGSARRAPIQYYRRDRTRQQALSQVQGCWVNEVLQRSRARNRSQALVYWERSTRSESNGYLFVRYIGYTGLRCRQSRQQYISEYAMTVCNTIIAHGSTASHANFEFLAILHSTASFDPSTSHVSFRQHNFISNT